MFDVATAFIATKARIVRQTAELPEAAAAIIEEEMRGLYHGLFIIFDGGSALANEGLVSIVDEDGQPFHRFMHEICFKYWPATEVYSH